MHCLVLFASSVLLFATALAPPALAGPILNEVCYDGSGADADEAFTEILGHAGHVALGVVAARHQRRPTARAYRTISLTGATIPSDGLLVLATTAAPPAAVLAARDLTANVDWQNGPDAVLLLDANGHRRRRPAVRKRGRVQRRRGRLRDRRRWPATACHAEPVGTDTNDNATDFSATSTPTPAPGPDVGGAGARDAAPLRCRRGRAGGDPQAAPQDDVRYAIL